MGIKRPLKSQVVAKYGEELAQAEKIANAGFDPKTKKLNEGIYGPTNVSFDPLAEMQVLAQNNVTDQSFLEASMQEFNQMEQPNMINDALDAVQSEDPSFPMPEAVQTPQAPQMAPQAAPLPIQAESDVEPEEEGPEVPEDPEERLNWVAEKLAAVKPGAPNAAALREWKRMHGNVFILQIDEYVFIYRYLKRQEWAQLQVNEGFHNMRVDQQEDYISEKCTLWPKFNPHTKGGLPAGAASMLNEQIRLQSMFLDPMQVANITIKL